MSKGGVGGGGREVANFGEVSPEPGGGERKKEVGHLVVRNEWSEGCCDAGDVIDGEERIISVMREGLQENRTEEGTFSMWWEDCAWGLFFRESVCEGFFAKMHLYSSTSSHLHICASAFAHLRLSSSSHLRIYTAAHLHICASTSLLIFTSAHLHLCSSSHLHICASSHLRTYILTSSHLRISHLRIRSSFLSLLRPGAVPPEHRETQPSAEIVRVEGAKCR